VRERHGGRFIAPIDGDGGGAWIAVNHYGMTLCLLNGIEVAAGEREYQSRGWLLLDLIDCAEPQQVRDHINNMGLAHFQPFTLAAVQGARETLLFHWNGARLLIEENGEAQMPLISSSYETARVVAERRAQFALLKRASGRLDVALLDRFHRSHEPAPNAFSVCMHRVDAQTVSLSRVIVNRGQIEFLYYPQPPCCAAGITPYATRLKLVAK
jgi:hypothetical protein